MAKREAIKTKKICVACGGEFFGTAGKMTCDERCRSIVARLKKSGKRPEYMLMAKGKGQKIPDLSAPKRLKFKKGEKKQIPDLDILEEKINYQTPTAESYDGKQLQSIHFDETPMFVTEPPLDKFKKLTMINEIDRQIATLKRQESPKGMHPKLFRMSQDEKISELENQKKQLQ